MEKYTYLVPSYYKDFKCKCAQCRHSCCHGWQIPINEEEYFKLITMQCDQRLKDTIDSSFIQPPNVSPERYRIISFNWRGDCPMQKDGLCQIHKNLGEQYLPSVCQMYPRSLKEINGKLYGCCSSSCERVVEMLIHQDSLNMVEYSTSQKPNLQYQVNADFQERINHFSQIMKDRSTTLRQSIEQICLEVNKEEFIKDFNQDINPVKEAIYILSRLVSQNSFLEEIYQQIQERYDNNLYQYEIDKINFEKLFPNWNYIFENVMNNSLLFENFPFVDERFEQTNAYKGLCASYGLLRFVTISYTAIHPNEEALVDSISCLFHLIDHTSFYYNINIIVKSAALLLRL